MPFIQSILQPDSVNTQALNAAKNDVASLIKEGRIGELLDELMVWGISFGGKVLIGAVVFFVGRWIISKILHVQDKILVKRDMDAALKGFLRSIFRILLYILLLLLIINIVGAQTVSLTALLASAGLAIGLAVKDNLANFAGGVMLLFNKPFKGGDYIQVQGLEGTVQTVGILYTMLTSVDNKTLYIPNGPLSSGSITNFTKQGTRRLDATASAEYGTPVELVKETLLSLINNHPKVLKTPEPVVRMTKMHDSSIDFELRVWTTTADFWEMKFWLNEAIYGEFSKRGIGIPFPQLTVHMTGR